MKGLFVGPPLHWVLWAALLLTLYLLGTGNLHTRAFNLFSLVVLALVMIAFAVIFATSRPGGRPITREPLDEGGPGDLMDPDDR
jgi:hypothetical protein